MVTFSDGDYVLLTVVNVLLPIWVWLCGTTVQSRWRAFYRSITIVLEREVETTPSVHDSPTTTVTEVRSANEIH